jgi:biotin-(acetyl-CoA carboxylase) ligase
VSVSQGEGVEITGRIVGLNREGALRLRNRSGEMIEVLAGDLHLRHLNK